MDKIKSIQLGLIGTLFAGIVFVGGCAPVEAEEGETSIWPMLIFVGLLFVLMYFVMIRPQRKRQQEHQQLIDELNRGDRVITAGGIYGVVDSISEDSVIIRVESGTTMRVAKNSVSLKQERKEQF